MAHQAWGHMVHHLPADLMDLQVPWDHLHLEWVPHTGLQACHPMEWDHLLCHGHQWHQVFHLPTSVFRHRDSCHHLCRGHHRIKETQGYRNYG